MFGSSKNATGIGSLDRSGLTGLERARLERARDPIGADDIPPMPLDAAYPPGLQSTTTAPPKKGPSMTERARTSQEPDSSAQLYIGAAIRLKGEIAGCDLMRVEGTFEGTAQARQLVVCPGGTFVGTAQIEEAEVEGSYEGTLVVRGRLFLRSTGRIRGTFSYGQLEIERGGEIDGKINPYERPVPRSQAEALRPVDAAGPRPVPAAAPVPRPAAAQVAASQPARPAPAAAPNPAPRPAASGPRTLDRAHAPVA